MPSGGRRFCRRWTQMDADAGGGALRRNRTMEPMPSGGRVHHRGHRAHRGRGNARCARGSKNGFSVISVVILSCGHAGRGRRFWTMNPMPSGGGGDAGAESAGAAGLEPRLAQEGADVGGAGAMLPAGAATAGKSGGRAGAGAEATMHPTAAVRHGGLAAGAAATGVGAASRRSQEIAGAIAVLQTATAVGRQAGPGRNRFRTINPMPSERRRQRSARGHGGELSL